MLVLLKRLQRLCHVLTLKRLLECLRSFGGAASCGARRPAASRQARAGRGDGPLSLHCMPGRGANGAPPSLWTRRGLSVQIYCVYSNAEIYHVDLQRNTIYPF